MKVLRGGVPATQRVVHTLDELDERLAYLDAAGAVSDDELRRGFETFVMEVDFSLPDDPFSPEYRQAVLDSYQWLHGSTYETSNEHTEFDLAHFVNFPFPFSTQSGATAGDYFIAIGHILRTLDLPPASRILEFGPGWGHTSVWLAQLGHHVTAIDISQNFVDLIEARAAMVDTKVHMILGDFSAASELDDQFDAVLFFESFHHCTDHMALLESLDRIVAPGGRVLFAAEPITEDFYAPWGLRLDGESLWVIRKNGWFEIGFRKSYFFEALRRAGWMATEVNCSDSPRGQILVASRLSEQ